MQGRIYPSRKKTYNLFPRLWKKEFLQLKKIGFNYLELLYDKRESTNNPISYKSNNLDELTAISKNKLYSVNLDYFSDNNFFKDINKSKKLLGIFYLFVKN